MLTLFDNYEMDVSRTENVIPNKLREDDEFINAVLDTQVMKTAMYFLSEKGFPVKSVLQVLIKNAIILNLIEIIYLQVWCTLIGRANFIF